MGEAARCEQVQQAQHISEGRQLEREKLSAPFHLSADLPGVCESFCVAGQQLRQTELSELQPYLCLYSGVGESQFIFTLVAFMASQQVSAAFVLQRGSLL